MDRIALTRMRELATTERSELDRLLDETLIAHIGLRNAAGDVMVVPTALVRDGDSVLIHGSTGSGLSERWTDTGLVFTTRYGTPIEPRNFNRSFGYRIAQATVRRINVHGTRKTCGTLLAALDIHSRVAMQILRYSRIAVTMEIYIEATSEATRDALKRLGDELSPPGD